MNRVGFLFEKIASLDNLLLAHENARQGKNKLTNEGIKLVDSNPEKYCRQIQQSLLDGTFHTSAYKEFTKIDSGKERNICELPYYPDRIVHWSILQVLSHTFIRQFIPQTYAALPHRGPHKALERLKRYLSENPLRPNIVSS